jgi:hypothetical protein
MTREGASTSWVNDSRIRAPFRAASYLAPVGGLLIALAAYRSSETDDLGRLFTYWYFYLGVVLVLGSGVAHLLMARWVRKHPL